MIDFHLFHQVDHKGDFGADQAFQFCVHGFRIEIAWISHRLRQHVLGLEEAHNILNLIVGATLYWAMAPSW